MCNVAADVMAKMEQTVRQFLDEGRMFTGYDVTLETRDREKMNLKHRDCRGAVHDMTFLNDAVEFGYDVNGQTVKWAKTQIDMGNGGAWAFVYHPANLDPKSYTPRQTQSAPAQQNSSVVLTPTTPVATAAPAAADDSTANDSGGENPDGTFSPDYRNRLMVKTRFARSIGLKPGDDVVVVCDSAKQTITLLADQASAPQPGNGIGVSTQRVERNGDFRLSSATLRSAGLTCSKFKVESSQQPAASGVGSNMVEIFAA
jgi:hypothetical protein